MTATVQQQAFAEAWDLIAEIAIARGEAPLNELGRLFHIEAGRWELWINGGPEQRRVGDDGPYLDPFHCYVQYNGWPAGFMDPMSATIAAGEAANIEALRDALKELSAT